MPFTRMSISVSPAMGLQCHIAYQAAGTGVRDAIDGGRRRPQRGFDFRADADFRI
jgi:hypothetical protein